MPKNVENFVLLFDASKLAQNVDTTLLKFIQVLKLVGSFSHFRLLVSNLYARCCSSVVNESCRHASMSEHRQRLRYSHKVSGVPLKCRAQGLNNVGQIGGIIGNCSFDSLLELVNFKTVASLNIRSSAEVPMILLFALPVTDNLPQCSAFQHSNHN